MAALSAPARGELPPPNILLLVAEDLSPRIGAFGDVLAVTPNIDQLAARGTRYTRTFTTAGVCAPSRAALITGVHQNTLGAGHMRSHAWPEANYYAVPPAEVKAFPELLRAAGYFTYATAKLDYQFSGTLPGSGPFTIWDAESRRQRGVSWRDRPGTQPFFGMYAFMETHESGLFKRCCWPASPTQLIMGAMQAYLHRGTEDQVAPEAVVVPPYLPDTPEVRGDIARQYNNSISMDRAVGEILAQLRADGLADDTIVIWTTDHGDGLPRGKRELFDTGIAVPMVIYWPERYRPTAVAPGSSDARLISFVDLAPTILALAGVPAPDFIQGRDFLDPAAEPRTYIYAARDRLDEWPDRQRAVRDRRYKYLRNYRPQTPGARHLDFRDNLPSMQALWRLLEEGGLNADQRRWFEPRPLEELYDTQVDPHELHNLAGDPAYAAVLQRLRDALSAWQLRVPDRGALPESELAELSWPGGEAPLTAAPLVEMDEVTGRVTMASATPGASLGYRINDGPWHLYVEPVVLQRGETLTAKSVRYGWRESVEVEQSRGDH
ncbi:sulfatase family protein [Parahaliea aestuarii]